MNCCRDMVMNGIEDVCGAPMGYGMMMAPISGTTDTVFPTYVMSMPQTVPAIKSDSVVTYVVPASRKRSRDALNFPVSSLPAGVHNQQNVDNRFSSFSFLGEDLSVHFLQQQLEIDRCIAQHTEKVRTEIEERRKRYWQRIAAAIEENTVKKLKAKEEEIVKIGKLNFALEERVKSLSAENQILKDLAQTNEATTNALRFHLRHVLAQVQEERPPRGGDGAAADDAQSCACEEDQECSSRRACRWCGNAESCVVLLPCRHLCLCTACASSVHTCPVCRSVKTGSVLVNSSADSLLVGPP